MNNTKKILSIFVGKTFIKLILLIGISSSLFSQQKSNNINFILQTMAMVLVMSLRNLQNLIYLLEQI